MVFDEHFAWLLSIRSPVLYARFLSSHALRLAFFHFFSIPIDGSFNSILHSFRDQKTLFIVTFLTIDKLIPTNAERSQGKSLEKKSISWAWRDWIFLHDDHSLIEKADFFSEFLTYKTQIPLH